MGNLFARLIRATSIRGSLSAIIAASALISLPSFAENITIQGKVTDSSGQPVRGATTSFRVQIFSPDSANHCVLYDETHVVDLSASYGLFSINLGKVDPAHVTRSAPTSYSIEQAISNRTAITVPGSFCSPVVSGTATYIPNKDDVRKVLIQFRDPDSMTAFEVIPEMDLNPVAYAIESRSVGGFPANTVLRVVNGGGVPAATTAFTTAEDAELHALVGGVSTKYVGKNSTTGVQIPTGAPTAPAAGSIWFSGGNLNYSDGTSTHTVGTSTGGTITEVGAGTGLSGGGTTGVVSLALSPSGVGAGGSVGSASSVPVLTYDTYGRITGASSATISGTAPGGSASGDLTGNYPAPTVARVQGIAFSASAPAAGQIYKFDDKGTPSAADDEFVPGNIFAGDLKSTSLGALLPGSCAGNEKWFFNSGTGAYECGLLSGITGSQLENFGPGVGTFRSVSVDAKGRVSAGTNPTTLAGYFISDAVQNATGVPSIAAGLDATPPASPVTGQLYVATDTKKIYRYNGASWDVIAATPGTGTITDVLAGTGVAVSTSGSTRTVSLPNVGTANTYLKVTTDAQGRVASGSTALVDTDIPSLPWSKIGSGKPTDLAGYGITDTLLKNSDGTVPNITSGLESALPTPSGANLNHLYIANNTKKIFRQIAGTWEVIGAAPGAGFTGSLAGEVSGPQGATQVDSVNGVSRATIAANSATIAAATDVSTASTLMKRDAAKGFAADAANLSSVVLRDSGAKSVTLTAPTTVGTSYTLKFPANVGGLNQVLTTDASGNLSWSSPAAATAVSGTLPITVGGTASAPVVGIQTANGTQAGALSSADWTTFSAKLSSALASANILVGNAGGVATGVALSGDATLSNTGALTVTGIRGKSVSAAPSVAGQVLRYDGTNLTPSLLSLADIRSNVSGSSTFTTTCSAGQTLTWNSGTDVLTCQNISIAAATQLTGVLPIANGGTGASSTSQGLVFSGPVSGSGSPSFRALAASDLPSSASAWVVNAPDIYRATGNVGIGTTTPATKLEVAGTIKIADGLETCSIAANGGMIRYNGGNLAFCNGSSWQTLGISGAGLTSLNGLTASTQSFANGTAGTAPGFVSTSGTHTLNIPMASGAGVTAGLVNKTDYDSFVGKLSSALNSANIFVGNGSNVATGVAVSGDATLANTGALSVTGIRGVPVSAAPSVTGQVLRYNGTSLAPALLSLADIRSNVSGSSTFSTTCSASQTLTWNSGTDVLSCQNISIAAATQLTGVLPVANGGTGAASASQNFIFAGPATGGAGAPAFRALAASDLPTSASAWTVSGSDVYRVSGNVGIGTTTMANKLDVNGGVAVGTYAGTAAPANGLIVSGRLGLGESAPGMKLSVSDDGGVGAGYHWLGGFYRSTGNFTGVLTGYASNGTTDTNGMLYAKDLAIYTGASAAESMRITAAGYVGIGTTAPGSLLDLRGGAAPEIRISPDATIRGRFGVSQAGATLTSGSLANSLVIANDGGALHLGTGTASPSAARMTIDTSGNVGIGTTAPQAGLDVKTLTNASAIIVPRDTVANRPATAVNGMIRYASDTNVLEAYVNGAWTTIGTLGGAQSFAGNVSVGGTLTSTGAATFNNGATVAGAALNMSSQNITSVGSNITGSSALTVAAGGTNQALALRSSGTGAVNVGTGNGTGLSVLDAGASTVNYVTVKGSAAGVSPVIGTAGADTNIDLTLSPKGTGRTVIPAGNVGIGTTSPGVLLDVQAASPAISPTIRVLNSSSSSAVYPTVTASNYAGATTGHPAMLLSNSRGTFAAPTATQLNDILGAVVFSGQNDASTQTQAARIQVVASANYAAGSNPTDMLFSTSGATGGYLERARILANGNFGVGTNSPGRLVEFSNAASTSVPQLRLRDSAGFWDLWAGANFLLQDGSANTRLFINGSNGNVGIGTTGPGYNLDVNSTGTAVSQFKSSYAGLSYSDFLNSSNNASAGVDLRIVTRNVADTANTAVDMVKYKNGKFVIHNTETDAASSVVVAVAGADRMTVNSSGNVGIGTTAPASRLHVDGNITLYDSSTSGGATPMGNIYGGTAGRRINFYSNTTSANSPTWFEMWGANGNARDGELTVGANYMSLRTGATGSALERMRIDTAGLVGIGTSLPSRNLDVIGNTRTSNEFQSLGAYGLRQVYGNYGFMHYQDGSNYYQLLTNSGDQYGGYNGLRPYYVNLANGNVSLGSNTLYVQHGGNVGVGSTVPAYRLDVNGTLRGYGITDSSDIRLKRDVKPLEDSLARILKLRGVNYFWKDQEKGKGEQIGFIAQEIEKVFPDLVSTDPQGMKSVNYSHLVAPIVESIKTLAGRMVGTETRVTALEAENARLKAADEAKGRELASIKAKNAELQAAVCEINPKAKICRPGSR